VPGQLCDQRSEVEEAGHGGRPVRRDGAS
jgi:hypothetical protein